jgi:predicted MFS family arabinose efflux permease
MRQTAAALFCKIVLNTARRFAYPFAPALSRGLGVPLTAVTSLIAVNQATSVLALLFGPLIDRLGYRLMMFAGMVLLVLGMIAGGLLPFYGVLLVSIFLAGLGKGLFDPALQAYVGRRVPFERRGLVIGVLEISWALSLLAGIPLIGLLIDRQGWRAPFFLLAGCGLLGIAALWATLSREKKNGHVNGMFKSWRMLVRSRPALGMLGFTFCISAANDALFVIYGAWFETGFGLTVVALGFTTTVIGVAELAGEGLTAALSDRLGMRRALLIGTILSTASYALLPALGASLPLAMTGLFIVFLFFEFTVVTAMSLSTELVPGARATMMSALMAAAGAGRVAGALAGGPVWLLGGVAATGWSAATLNAVGLLFLYIGAGRKH